MSLSSAISTAQQILSNTSTQTATLSRNIANASNPEYSRRAAILATSLGGAQVVTVSRSSDAILLKQNFFDISTASGQNVLLDGMERLKSLLGTNDYETSPAALMGNLRDALQIFATKPNDVIAAQSAVASATDLADSIRTSSVATQKLRKETDDAIAGEVTELNRLLADFQVSNTKVVNGTNLGRDVSDALDERDSLMRRISSIVGITVVTRPSNDIALYTTGGATLFETVPRAITFQTTPGYSASITGQPVLVDGVPIEMGVGSATTARGSLAGLLQLRDETTVTFQHQLDEMTRGLMDTVPDLFVAPGPVGTPIGLIEPGLSSSLRVNSAYVLAAGGDPFRLRDGVDYSANPTGEAGFSGLVDSFVTAFDTPRAFDATARAGEELGLIGFAANSVGWLEAGRSAANLAAENKNAAYFRTTEALSNATGVNLDEELSLLLQLEQSYQASSRLIKAVDDMLNSLLNAVR